MAEENLEKGIKIVESAIDTRPRIQELRDCITSICTQLGITNEVQVWKFGHMSMSAQVML